MIVFLAISFNGCGSSYSKKLKFSEVQKNINSYSEEDQIKAVSYYPKNIKGITNPSLKVQSAAISSEREEACMTFQRIQKPHELIIKDILPKCGYAIKYIDNPIEEQQLVAVKNGEFGYSYVAFKSSGDSILKFIKNPSKKVQLEAVKHHGLAIKYIDNPTEEMQIEAVKNNSGALQYIKNPSEAMQIEAVKKSYKIIDMVENPTSRFREAALKYQTTYALKKYKNLTKKEQLIAVKELKHNAIKYIDNPIEEVQMIAVKANSSSIREIKNPTEKVQSYVLSEGDYNCDYIQNKTTTVAKKCNEINKFKNLRHNFLKDTTTATQSYFEVGNNILSARVYAVNGTTYVTNHTDNFIKLISFSVYYGEDIYTKQMNISLPPISESKFQSVSTETIIKKFYIPVKSYNQALNVGIAIEYEVNGQKETFYKNKVVKYKEY